jgi:hypothetical protein
MKIESEFSEVYLDFIRYYSITSDFQHDSELFKMIQRIRQIHRSLVIADHWTEIYSLWRNLVV